MRIVKNKNTYDPIKEARRYVDNANEALRDRGKLNVEWGCYEDPKYVKAAGNYLWLGVLIALEAVFHVKEEMKKKKGDTRVSVDDYIRAASQRDLKLLSWVNDGYKVMHLSMNYDGIQDKDVCKRGIQLANDIIDRCEVLLAN